MLIGIENKIGAALIAIIFGASPTLPTLSAYAAEPTYVAQHKTSFEQDRVDILAMAGNYKVTFDMKETTSWQEDYTPIKAKISGGYESVYIIKDTGTEIILQHLLVVESADDDDFIVKHWRQDWKYEPHSMLVYAGPGKWKIEDIPEIERKGAWSQTVYQVDDSPRYGGIGRWKNRNGVRGWVSDITLRPLPRRDAIRRPDYDYFHATNRHQLMPGGWIHWQDNTKMKMVDGKVVPYVQESVLNTYKRFDGYNAKAADNYWRATTGYWAAVRGEWDAVINQNGGVAIKEEAHTGTVISQRLLEMGTQLEKGDISEIEAIKRAKALIISATTLPYDAAPISHSRLPTSHTQYIQKQGEY